MSEPISADQLSLLNKQLLEAAKANDLALVERLVRQGAQASFEYHEDGTWGASEDDCPLRYAVAEKNIDMARFLLQNGAKTTSKFGSTDWRGCGSRKSVFETACAQRDPELLRLFLQFGADPNTRSNSHTSSMRTSGSASWALLHSCIGSYEEVKILLEAGADANSLKNERYSNERGYNSRVALSPLHLACRELRSREDRLRTALLLLKHKANINAIATTTAHVPNPEAANATTDDPRQDGFISDVTCEYKESTALHFAIQAEDVQLVYALLLRGADPSIPCKIESRQPTLNEMVEKSEVKSCEDLAQECNSAAAREAILALLHERPTWAKLKAEIEPSLNSQSQFVTQLVDVIIEYL